jgi:hypothetical protein
MLRILTRITPPKGTIKAGQLCDATWPNSSPMVEPQIINLKLAVTD